MNRAWIIAFAVCACDNAKPATKPDPWASTSHAPSAEPPTDPWGSTAGAPTPAAEPSPASSGLPEGDWKCDLVARRG